MDEMAIRIATKVSDSIPGVQAEAKEVIKNNDVVYTGIILTVNGCNVAPTVYIDKYLKHGYTEEEIIDYVINSYNANKNDSIMDIAENIDKFSLEKSYLNLQLVNKEMNHILLQNIPYKDFLDLAVIVILKFEVEPGSYASVKINSAMLKLWGKSFESVYASALPDIEFDLRMANCIAILDRLKEEGVITTDHYNSSMLEAAYKMDFNIKPDV